MCARRRARSRVTSSPGGTGPLCVVDGVAHREIEGQVLLLGPDSPNLFTLNDTGRFLWARVVRGADEAALARALQRRFRLDADAALRDVRAFVAALEAHGLVSR